MMKIMKKNYIKVMAAAALVLVSACSQENELGGDSIQYGENTIVFNLGSPSTRSAVALSDVAEQGVTIPLGTDESGTSFYLEESVIDLNAPITRGTPAYTENVGALYKSFAASCTQLAVTNAEFKNTPGTNKWVYTHTTNMWDKGDLDFYMYMPMDMTVAPEGGTAPVSNLNFANQKITFKYTSPDEAANQKDILFSYRQLSMDDYDPDNGASVLFHHALTGVKFRLGNTENDITENDITITGITFTGLYASGECTVTPRDEADFAPGVDNPTGDYSSKSAVVWDQTKMGSSDTPLSSGTIDGTVDFDSGNFGSEDLAYPNSFANKHNDNNLNKADGSQTFWLIPQPIKGNVKLKINYEVGKDKHEWTIDFGKAITQNGEVDVEWKAGQLRTYTIKIDQVNVKIEDAVTIGQDQTTTYTDDKGNTHTIYGGTKSGIAITNTGNTDAFMRVAITGQWVDKNGAPVFSFTDFTQSDIIQEIASWYDDQFGEGEGIFGVFDGLVGYTKNGKDGSGNTGWVKGKDGYYYYTTKVAPSATTGTAPFNSYTVTLANVPKIKVAGALQDVHFVMEVSTQAISAKKLDGSDYAWNKAWENALGKDPSASN